MRSFTPVADRWRGGSCSISFTSRSPGKTATAFILCSFRWLLCGRAQGGAPRRRDPELDERPLDRVLGPPVTPAEIVGSDNRQVGGDVCEEVAREVRRRDRLAGGRDVARKRRDVGGARAAGRL